MPDSDVNIRLSATRGDTSAISETGAEVQKIGEQAKEAAAQVEAASKALDDLAKDRPSPKIIDSTIATPASGSALPTSKPGGLGVDLSHEADLAAAMATAAAPVQLSHRDQAKELIANTQQFKAELRDLLNLPGERTRDEIERITEAIGVLRANAGEARLLAATAAEGGEAALASRLYTAATAAENAAQIQTSLRTARAAEAAAGEAADGASGSGHSGMRWSEAAAAKEGLRAVGEAGGFFTERMAMAVSQLGILRIALFSLGGVIFGTVIGAFAGLVGWIAKAAAEAPQFHAGLQSIETASNSLGNELNRTAKPLTDFVGKMAGDTLEWFADRITDVSDGLSELNGKLGIPDADQGKRLLEDMGRAAQNLTQDLEGVASAAERMNGELEKTNATLDRNRDSAKNAASAQEKLEVSHADLAEAKGDVTPEHAEQMRQAAREKATNARYYADAAAETGKRDEAQRLADDLSKQLADSQKKYADMRARQADALANGPRTETMEETRARLDKGRTDTHLITTPTGATFVAPERPAATDEEVRKANAEANKPAEDWAKKAGIPSVDDLEKQAAAIEQLQKQLKQAQQTKTTSQNNLDTINSNRAADANEAQAAEARAKKQAQDEADRKAKEAREKQINEELDGIAAAHTLRMATISASGQKDIQIAQQRYDETMRELQARKQLEDELGKLQGEDDAQRQARLDRYNADAIEAQQQLAQAKARDQKLQTKDAEAEWRAGGPKHGGIDARAQNEYDLAGNLTRHHGIDVEPPKESLQRLVQGAGDAKGGASQLTQPANQSATALAQAKAALDKIVQPAQALAQHADQSASQIQQAHNSQVKAMSDVAKSTADTTKAVQQACTAIEKSLQEITKELHDIVKREADRRHS